MARVAADYSYGERSAEDLKRALPAFVMIMLALVGVVWLNWKEIPAGTIYLGLFIYGLSALVLLMFFTKSTDNMYEVPIATRVYDFVVMFVLGWIIPILLYFIPKMFGYQSIVTAKYFVPLAFSGSTGGVGAQTFSVLSTQADPFWRSFVTVITAGTLEPFAVGFASVALGVIIGYVIRKLLGPLPTGLDFGEEGNKWFDFAIAMIYSTAFFVIIHRLNNSYVLVSMFIAAGVFRMTMNVLLYYINLTLGFLFGFHQSNNAIAMGLSEFFSGMISNSYGWVILGFYILILVSFFVNIKQLPEVFKRIAEEIGL